MNGFTQRLVLTQRQKATRKWPILIHLQPNVCLSSSWRSLDDCEFFSQRHLQRPELRVIKTEIFRGRPTGQVQEWNSSRCSRQNKKEEVFSKTGESVSKQKHRSCLLQSKLKSGYGAIKAHNYHYVNGVNENMQFINAILSGDVT